MGAFRPGVQIARDLMLVRRLGVGGMASVWLADDQRRGRVVVKFLAAQLVENPDARRRFEREVTATLEVRSPHVVEIFDHGITDEGVPYIVMEQLQGADLAKVMKQRRLVPEEVLHIVEGVAAALQTAHDRGIVHRDIKPANVFLCHNGNGDPNGGSPFASFVKLVDFGIAKRLEDEAMTATNAILGTPSYMSPEQLGAPGGIDRRSDLWALGVLVFQMLSGKPPFSGAHIATVIHSVLNGEIPRLSEARPGLPARIDGFIARALSRDKAGRFDSAGEFARGLREALTPEPDESLQVTRLRTAPVERVSSLPDTTMPLGAPRPQAPVVPVARVVLMSPAAPVLPLAPTSPAVAFSIAPARATARMPKSTYDSMGAATLAPQAGGPRRRSFSLSWWATATALGAVVIVAGTLRFTAASADGARAAAAPVRPVEVVPTPPVAPPVVAATGTVIGASPAAPRVPAATTAPSARPGAAARKLRFPWHP